MFIEQVTIYGFGQFVDRQFNFDESFTCFYGKNETGKSTLQHFIRFMLFGLPPRQRKLYMPKTSGKLGGRLTIVDEKVGKYTIERIDGQNNAQATCYLTNGAIKDETWLIEQLNHFTYETYTSVYSFSALDLIDFDQMNAQEIGDVILSVGLTGAKHIYTLEKSLDKQLGDLFKPSGRIPTINKQLTNLAQLQKQLFKQEKRLTAYKNKQMNIEALTTDIKQILEQRQQLKNEINHLSKLLQSLPLIHDHEYHMGQLNNLPSQIDFPEKGIERYENLKETLIPLQSELTFIHEQMSSIENNIKQLQVQLLSEELIQQLKDIVQKQSLYKAQSSQLANEFTDIQQELTGLTKQLNQLNIQMTLADLTELSFPFQTQNYWQSLHNDQQQINHEKEHCNKQIHQLSNQDMILSDQLDMIEQTLLSSEEREQNIESINQLKNNTYDSGQTTLINNQLNREKRKKNLVFSVSIVSSIILFLSGYVVDQSLFVMAGLLLIVLGGIYTYILNESINKIARLVAKIEQTHSPTELKRYNDRLARLEKDDALIYEQGSLKDELKRNRTELLQWEEKQRAIEQREQRLHTQLHAAKRVYPFIENVQLEYWPELYYELNQIKDKYEKLLKKKVSHKQLIEQQENFEQQVTQLIDELNLAKKNLSITKKLEALVKFMDEQMYMKQQIDNEQTTLEDLTIKHKGFQKQLDLINDEISQLFKVAQVETEEHFYQQAAIMKTKATHQTTVQKLHKQLILIFQQEKWQQLIDRPLEEKLLLSEKDTHEHTLAELEQTLDDQRQLLANLQAEMSQLEQSNDYSTLKHQFQIEKNELNHYAKQWAVLKTAEQMLERTKQTYQQKYLTEVLQQTSEYFKQMTHGVYTAVLLTKESETLMVQTDHQLYFDLTELSKGTIDQLYIALRLAVGKIIGGKYKFPFIIDDAFIHSDVDRAAVIVQILQHMSKEQQLILFTCQKHIAAHFSADQLQSLESNIYV